MRLTLLLRIMPRMRFGVPTSTLLAAWCGVLFFHGIAAGPLYRTESLRAIIGAECLRGHWLYPVLYGEPFLTKPPGHYVAIAVCSLPFGKVTDWSARLPSALAATMVVFLMWGMLRTVLDERWAFLAALLIPTSVLWLDKAPSAEIDMTLTAWVAASLALFHKAIARPRASLWVASLLCVAAGTLTKWTAPAFFYLTVVPFLAWRGELRVLFGWRHLLAAGIALAVISGWAAAVAGDVGWNKLIDTISSEASYRFHAPAKHRGNLWVGVATYPLLVLAAHLPLAFFALRTLRPSFLRKLDDCGRLLVQLLHCWVWPNLLFWSLVPNHNVRYALPLSPGLMALGALGLFGAALPFGSRLIGEGLRIIGDGSRLIRLAIGFLFVWLVAKIAFVELVIPRRTEHRDARPTAAQLRELVPEGVPLYVHKLKDEGITFYFGRDVRKLREPRELPHGAFIAMIQQEWDARTDYGDVQLVRWMYDQQGDPMILVHRD